MKDTTKKDTKKSEGGVAAATAKSDESGAAAAKESMDAVNAKVNAVKEDAAAAKKGAAGSKRHRAAEPTEAGPTIVCRCSPRHPPHTRHIVPVLATSSTAQCAGARHVHVIHVPVCRCSTYINVY